MIDAIQKVKNALGYAKFDDLYIKSKTDKLLSALEKELDSEDYEPGLDVEQAVSELQDAFDSTDSLHEDASDEAKNDDSGDDDLEGFGEDEDEDAKP